MPGTWRPAGLLVMGILGAVGCAQGPYPASPPQPAPGSAVLAPQAPVVGTGTGPGVALPGAAAPGQSGPRVDVPWSGDYDNPVVIIQDGRFQPYYTRVRMGGRVTWINRDRTTHSVISPIPGGSTREGAWGGVLAPGESFTKTFNRFTGTFTYHSTFDRGLTGNVIVIGDRRQDLFWSEHFAL